MENALPDHTLLTSIIRRLIIDPGDKMALEELSLIADKDPDTGSGDDSGAGDGYHGGPRSDDSEDEGGDDDGGGQRDEPEEIPGLMRHILGKFSMDDFNITIGGVVVHKAAALDIDKLYMEIGADGLHAMEGVPGTMMIGPSGKHGKKQESMESFVGKVEIMKTGFATPMGGEIYVEIPNEAAQREIEKYMHEHGYRKVYVAGDVGAGGKTLFSCVNTDKMPFIKLSVFANAFPSGTRFFIVAIGEQWEDTAGKAIRSWTG